MGRSLRIASRALLLAALLAPPFVHAAGAPQVLYTDVLSGPTTGGENGKGGYLSVFGRGFGTTGLGTSVKVFVNHVEVESYRTLGPSKGRPDVQQLTVQVGALGSPALGVPLPITVVANGIASNSNHTFTVQPGDVLFVDNVGGDDATAVKNDPAHPWQHVQLHGSNPLTGAMGQVQPGDTVVLRGKGAPWTDLGFDDGAAYFLKFRKLTGSAPTGVRGAGPITITGYPGEDVHVHPPAPAAFGVIAGVNGDNYPDDAKWITLSNLRVEGGEHDGPVNLENLGNSWRVVNNDLSAPDAPASSRSGGVAGNGREVAILGNHIHHVAGNGQENHGVYIDREYGYEIAYNSIHDITGGNGIQFYNVWLGTTHDASIHHNLIHHVAKHGINVADGSGTGFALWDNVVWATYHSGLRFNTTDLHGARVWSNTFAETATSKNPTQGAVSNDWNLAANALDLRDNILAPSTGTNYFGGSNGLSAAVGTFEANLYHGGADSPLAVEPGALQGDPAFASAASGDFHLLKTSAAVDVGSASVAGLVFDDFDLSPRPQGKGFDIGAFELSAGCALASDCSDAPPTCHATGASCEDGACVFPFASGLTACSVGDPCTTGDHCDGAGRCVAGPSVCLDAGLPTGPDAGPADAAQPPLDAGTSCVGGQECTSLDGCRTGTIECTAGQAACGALRDVSDGTACAGGVCKAGTCRACASTATCSSLDGCKAGAIDCSSGAPVCSSLTSRPEGTPCTGGVCSAGACSSCLAGQSCASVDGCQAGTLSCASGQAVCGAMKGREDGAPCPGGACKAGVCHACAAGAFCKSDDQCRTGAVECSTGAPACNATTAVGDGTPCPGGVCGSGTCRAGGPGDAGLGDGGAALSDSSGCGCAAGQGRSAWGLLALALWITLRPRDRRPSGT